MDTSYKVTEETSTYKKTNNVVSSSTLDRHGSPSYAVNRSVAASPSGDAQQKHILTVHYINYIFVILDAVDSSPNIRVSKNNAARRDSWDVINKTKHLLSHNSLESLANMTEGQLNTDLSYGRSSVDRDAETERNTRYNKLALGVEKQRLEAKRSFDEQERRGYAK